MKTSLHSTATFFRILALGAMVVCTAQTQASMHSCTADDIGALWRLPPATARYPDSGTRWNSPIAARDEPTTSLPASGIALACCGFPFVAFFLRQLWRYSRARGHMEPLQRCDANFVLAQRTQGLQQRDLSFQLNCILITLGVMTLGLVATLTRGVEQLMTPGSLPVSFACGAAIASWGFARERADRKASEDERLQVQIDSISSEAIRDELIVARAVSQMDKKAGRTLIHRLGSTVRRRG